MRTKRNSAAATKFADPQPHTGDQNQQDQPARQPAQAHQKNLAQQTQQKKNCRPHTDRAAPAAHASTVHAAAVNRPGPTPQPAASLSQPAASLAQSAASLSQPATSLPQPALPLPLLPMPQGCVTGGFVQRRKRFSVELRVNGEELWVHSNNSGSMLGLTRPGSLILASPAANPARKLKYTQECVWLPQTARPTAPANAPSSASPASASPASAAPATAALCGLSGFWVGVNTNTPNRMLEAAFHAGRLDFTQGYTSLVREAKRGQSRLDGLLTGPGLPPLWVECKNVTMVEDDAACFPDAASERGQKHLRELMDIVAQGERAAMLYLVQRPDGRCFAPADFIDPEYARLFYEALACGVEVYPYRALVSKDGIDLGGLIPLRPAPQYG